MSAAFLEAPLSLYSIPAAWVLAHIPQIMKVAMITKASKGYNNLNPRSNVAKTAANDAIDARVRQKIARVEGAHLNGLESYPLWSIAVLAANFAGLSQSTINKAALVYLGSRTLFNYIYIKQSKEWHSSMRTLVWVISVASSITLLVKSANLVSSR